MQDTECTCARCEHARQHGVADVPNANIALDARYIVFIARKVRAVVADMRRAEGMETAAEPLWTAEERLIALQDVAVALGDIETEILSATVADVVTTRPIEPDEEAEVLASGILANDPTASRH